MLLLDGDGDDDDDGDGDNITRCDGDEELLLNGDKDDEGNDDDDNDNGELITGCNGDNEVLISISDGCDDKVELITLCSCVGDFDGDDNTGVGNLMEDDVADGNLLTSSSSSSSSSSPHLIS